MADANTAVYVVVDKSKKRTSRSLPEKDAAESKAAQSFDSPAYDLAERDVSNVPASGKNEKYESEYSMVSLENMYPNTPPRATAQVNQQLSQPTNRMAKKTPEKERSWNEGTSCKIFTCIFITIAVVALILLICIAVLFAEVNKLKQTASPQQITSEAVKTDMIVNELLYQELVQAVENNAQQLNSSIEMLKLNQGILLLQHLGQSKALPPATSCAALSPFSPSGYYWVRASNGSAVRVFCDMTRSCGGVTGLWMRVAELNATEGCPSGLEHHQGRCRISSNSATCSPVIAFDTTHEYSKVCGKIIASPGGKKISNDGFRGFNRSMRLNGNYVDGVSLTHGNLGHHIWTFAASYIIPCSCNNDQDIRNRPPPFVENDYFCEVARRGVLWDGECYSGSKYYNKNSCCSFNHPPWFYRQLPQPTTDDIEMRVCRDQDRSNEDIEIQSVEIYVL